MPEVTEAIGRLIGVAEFSENDSFLLAKICGRLLSARSASENAQGRAILIRVLDCWKKIPTSHFEIWTGLLEAAGFYPYISQSQERSSCLTSLSQKLRQAYHVSVLDGVYFHEEQREVASLLEQGKNVLISAPTSFGKSLLIENAVASRKYRNIVVIQPTLALLDETRRKLAKYGDFYQIVVKTSQRPSDVRSGNIFLFTAERVMEYRDLPKIDFFVIDEFYKVSAKRSDGRSDVLNNAFHRLISHNAQFYLLGPCIDGISSGFAEKYNLVFIKSSFSLVETEEINVYEEHAGKFGEIGEKALYKERELYKLLLKRYLESAQQDQTMVYCSSPDRVRKLASGFFAFMVETSQRLLMDFPLVEWIERNISSDWKMIALLKGGIGIHDGTLPRHIGASIIEYFNERKLPFLFCTSTIIEGVNTSAKNIIFFDQGRGDNRVDFFDYSNIRGRSGRLMVHYVGRVFNFRKPPEKRPVIIDIPFFEQNPISPESLIQLSDSEVIDKGSDSYRFLQSLSQDERGVIREGGLSVSGQKKIIDVLQSDLGQKYGLICWTGVPTYEQLGYLLGLAWDYLLKPKEAGKFSKEQITTLVHKYGMNRSISQLIRSDQAYRVSTRNLSAEDALEEAILFCFTLARTWFEYKIPKLLSTIDRLQKFVCQRNGVRHGDYTFYASRMEAGFVKKNLAILGEYGVPISAIEKLGRWIDEDLPESEVLVRAKELVAVHGQEFIRYEVEKINHLA